MLTKIQKFLAKKDRIECVGLLDVTIGSFSSEYEYDYEYEI
jgi:hypothetical protein